MTREEAKEHIGRLTYEEKQQLAELLIILRKTSQTTPANTEDR